jgi:hypothetical protein
MTAYSTRHWRLRTQRGLASDHPCVKGAELGVGEQAQDWAQIHGEDGEDPWADYVPMCRRHHMEYDGSGHRQPHSEVTKALLSQKNRGYRHTPEAIEKIRASSTGRTLSSEARAKLSADRRGQVIPQAQRERISETLKGNTNASGQRSPQALDNIRRAQQERRRREREGGG